MGTVWRGLVACLFFILCAGCYDQSDLDPDFDPERAATRYHDKMKSGGSGNVPAEKQVEAAAELKRKLAEPGKERAAALEELEAKVCLLSTEDPAWAEVHRYYVNRGCVLARETAALAMRAFLVELLTKPPLLSDLLRPCLTDVDSETRARAKRIMESCKSVEGLAADLARDPEKFVQAAKAYEEYSGKEASPLEQMSKERRLYLYEKVAAHCDERAVHGVAQRLVLPGEEKAVDAEAVTMYMAVGVVPLFSDQYYKYGGVPEKPRWGAREKTLGRLRPQVAAVVEDTWICCHLLLFLPEYRAQDPEHAERWDEVVEKLEPVIVALTGPDTKRLRQALLWLEEPERRRREEQEKQKRAAELAAQKKEGQTAAAEQKEPAQPEPQAKAAAEKKEPQIPEALLRRVLALEKLGETLRAGK